MRLGGKRPEFAGYRINRYSLRFLDEAFESRFQASWIKATAPTLRVWAACGLAFYMIYSGLLAIFLPDGHANGVLIRFGLVIPLLLLAQYPLLNLQKHSYYLPLSFICSAVLAYTTALYSFVTASAGCCHQVYLLEMAAIFVFCQSYVRIQFPIVVIFTLVAGILTIAAVAIFPTILDAPVIFLVAIVAALGLTGCFSAMTRELFIRRNYWSIQNLKTEYDRVEIMAQEALKASQKKSQFVGVVSHELRTPLNAIIGYSDAIKSGLFGPIAEPRVNEYLSDINSSGHQLLELVNDILDITKATEGNTVLAEQPIEIQGFLAETCRSFDIQLGENGLHLSIAGNHDMPSLQADPKLLRQMISNLVSNAIKFTPPGGSIALTYDVDEDGQVRLSVNDTGIGIAPEKLEKALEMFEQVDEDISRRHGGAGIGLALTKKLMELHNGFVEIESTPGIGTTASLVFPVSRVVADDNDNGIRNDDGNDYVERSKLNKKPHLSLVEAA